MPSMSGALVRARREAAGWSQKALAEASGIPRATVGAIENGRFVPSVVAALAIARALGTSVESLFGSGTRTAIDRWARPALRAPVRFWQARVRDRLIAYPCEPLLSGATRHDGVLGADGAIATDPAASPDDTVVIATCDPSVSLAANALAEAGVRVIALPRPSKEALRLLREGLVHAAGVHFATPVDPDANRAESARMLRGEPQVLLHWADWDAGVAVRPGLAGASLDVLLDGVCRWVNRPKGAAARACLDRVIAARAAARGVAIARLPGYEHEARDHRSVVEIVASGAAEAGITVRACAEELALPFTSIETELYDICVPADLLEDRRLRALVDATGHRRFRRALAEVPGMGVTRTGETSLV